MWRQAEEKCKKSKERLEEEKRAILKQRIRPLDIEDADAAKLADKAKELHSVISRLEGEKYDLEKSFKARQVEVSVSNQSINQSMSLALQTGPG